MSNANVGGAASAYPRARVLARHGGLLLGIAVAALRPAPAAAQIDATLIQPAIPLDYDRGRNVAVTERARPDYDPLGVRRGPLIIYPRLQVGVGGSDNVFLTDAGARAAALALIAPSVRADTDWSRHAASINAGARFRRYPGYSRRDQDEWNVDGLGRLDIRSTLTLTGQAGAARVQEEPFTGAAASSVAALSSYRRLQGALRGQYTEGRVRATLSYDHQAFAFSDVRLTDGSAAGQRYRDRALDRVAGQVEYAFSPSVAAYGQAGRAVTRYAVPLAPGVANRDSTAERVIGGLSLDIAGLLRGAIGVGYSRRGYDSPLYRDVSGVSVEGRLQYFPSELTTLTLGLRRVIEDADLGVAGAYFDNRVSLRVDHEVLANLLVNAGAEYARQDYIGAPERDRVHRVQAGARYLASRRLGLQAELSYGDRRRSGGGDAYTISEAAGFVSLILQR